MLLTFLVFVAVTLAVAGLAMWLVPSRAEERLHAATHAPDASASAWSETVIRVARPFARLSSPTGEWDSSPLRLTFFHAGIRHPAAPVAFFAVKTVLPLVLALVAFLFVRTRPGTGPMLQLLYVTSAALVGTYIPNLLLHWRVRARQREIFENFPDAADLMLVCMEAGLGLDASLARVCDEMQLKSVALAEELHLTLLELRAGSTREKSLHNLARRTGVEEVGTFATMLTQAERFGTSIGESLRVYSDDLRHKRQMRAEEEAAKVPTKMLFPLVVCIFPSIIMVVLGPAIIQLVRTLMPMLFGRT